MFARLPKYVFATALLAATVATGQENQPATAPTEETVRKLLDRLQADEARIKELENKLAPQTASNSAVAPSGDLQRRRLPLRA